MGVLVHKDQQVPVGSLDREVTLDHQEHWEAMEQQVQ